jgi:hypothetical protein
MPQRISRLQKQLRVDRGDTLPHERAGSNPVWAQDFNFIAPPR